MKKVIMFAAILIVFSPILNNAQMEKATYSLKSDILKNQGLELDSQISELFVKIGNIIKDGDLINVKDIKVLPFQSTYKIGKDYIEIEKHHFIKTSSFKDRISEIKSKSIKLYTDGKKIIKAESVIFEKNYVSSDTNYVKIIDPSPADKNTDDILFTHKRKGIMLLNNKKLGLVKNTTAYPLRNEIKRDFLIPHLTTFYSAMLFISEAYFKSLKDSDSSLSEFLKKSTKY